ncbi:unnamed protein product [Parnassius apollo]|uniref:(apollo) hypothetical protein n=1 Tax=Parnassius apollo TaxID=110799 RepID=A0A8S3XFH3_PARAO|nr:unnamed protein product [Parnassius apollo]
MENIFEVLKTQESLEKTLNQRLDKFEARLEGSSKDLSLKDLSSDYINFKNFVYSTFTLLRQQINHLIVNMDAIESRHRKKFLLLGGVVENTNENVRELVASVITKNLGIKNCSSQSLQVCHRLGTISNGRPRPILIKFEDAPLRQELWAKKALLKGSPMCCQNI